MENLELIKRQDLLSDANRISKEIENLEDFKNTVTRFDEECMGIPAVKLFLIKEVEITTVTKNKLFGTRNFGAGKFESTLEVPNSIRNKILDIVDIKIQELTKELETIVPLKSRVGK